MTDRLPGANAFARVVKPLEAFLRVEASSGLVLLGATLVALLFANSPWRESYESFLHAERSHLVVNDGLMTFFFLVVGLEIRRELCDGSLSTLRTAALPFIAALGGIAVPAATGPRHHYMFEIYALDTKLNVTPGADAFESRTKVFQAMQGHVLGKAVYGGLFRRPAQ